VSPNYRCGNCGSTNIVVTMTTTIIGTGSTSWPVGIPIRVYDVAETYASVHSLKDDGPEWGWWAAYYPPHPIPRPRIERRGIRPVRAQARACRIDRGRWKRRRFVQRLRRRA
jgi:hypothetical protein